MIQSEFSQTSRRHFWSVLPVHWSGPNFSLFLWIVQMTTLQLISSLPSQALLPAQKTMPFQPNTPQVHAPEGELIVPNVFHDSFMYVS